MKLLSEFLGWNYGQSFSEAAVKIFSKIPVKVFLVKLPFLSRKSFHFPTHATEMFPPQNIDFKLPLQYPEQIALNSSN